MPCSPSNRWLRVATLVAAGALAPGCRPTPEPSAPAAQSTSSIRIVVADEVDWGHLNPLRGDQGPAAGTLWGDREAPVPSGFLVRFKDGFSSPPHIHPETYRALVVSGEAHNAPPDAPKLWLNPGSFWTQPAGEVHITAAQGSRNIAYVEIEKGPYLVKPPADAFGPPEQPTIIPYAEMNWTPLGDGTGAASRPRVAELAGNPGDSSITRWLVQLPAGFSGFLTSTGSELHAVVILGTVGHHATDGADLEPGSYFGSVTAETHRLRCRSSDPCAVYVRTGGRLTVW